MILLTTWTDEELRKLLILRKARVPFKLISRELKKSVNACHTKFYTLSTMTAKDGDYMEVLSNPLKFMEGKDLSTGETEAVGRAILRSRNVRVDGRSNLAFIQYDGGEVGHKIHTVIGPHLLLDGGLFESGPHLIVWLQPNQHLTLFTTYSTVFEED